MPSGKFWVSLLTVEVGEYNQALDAIDSVLEMQNKKTKEGQDKGDQLMSDVEKNFLLLYRLKIYQETSRWQELIDFVFKWKKSITDKL